MELNHITTPFFQAMDKMGPLLIDGFREGAGTATNAEFAQVLTEQLVALGNIRNTAIQRAKIGTVPGVAGRNCGIHVTWGDEDGFMGWKYRAAPTATDYSYCELLWNWLTGGTPPTVIAPRPPSTPSVPIPDTVCDARASTAPPLPSVVTVSSASYALGPPVTPESIVATFGGNLAAATATTNPWPATLGGLQITITDSRGTARLAPPYYVSPVQLLFLIPSGTATGTTQIAIGSQRSTMEVATAAPSIYTASQTGKGVAAATYLRITRAGVRSEGSISDGVPGVLGEQTDLTLYGTGMRDGPATATGGDVSVPVAQSQYQGLDQINLGPLPVRVGFGTKEIVIRQGEEISNITTVTFRAP